MKKHESKTILKLIKENEDMLRPVANNFEFYTDDEELYIAIDSLNTYKRGKSFMKEVNKLFNGKETLYVPEDVEEGTLAFWNIRL